jgi:hypothetical protein
MRDVGRENGDGKGRGMSYMFIKDEHGWCGVDKGKCKGWGNGGKGGKGKQDGEGTVADV